MKNLIVLLLVLAIMPASKAQIILAGSNTTLYLVRHGEKDPGPDPALSEAGKRRAGDLYRLMRDKKIARIYITPYRRTAMTADSLRIMGHVDTVYYAADATGLGLLKAIGENNDLGKAVLVIGHSNTLLRMATAFGVEGLASDIPDEEFDNFYTISFEGSKPVFLSEKYGTPSPPAK